MKREEERFLSKGGSWEEHLRQLEQLAEDTFQAYFAEHPELEEGKARLSFYQAAAEFAKDLIQDEVVKRRLERPSFTEADAREKFSEFLSWHVLGGSTGLDPKQVPKRDIDGKIVAYFRDIIRTGELRPPPPPLSIVQS